MGEYFDRDYELWGRVSIYLDDLLWEERLLPIQILHKAIVRYSPEFTKQEIKEVFSYLVHRKARIAHCEATSHNMEYNGANITPEHGTEWFKCKNCGVYETIHYY